MPSSVRYHPPAASRPLTSAQHQAPRLRRPSTLTSRCATQLPMPFRSGVTPGEWSDKAANIQGFSGEEEKDKPSRARSAPPSTRSRPDNLPESPAPRPSLLRRRRLASYTHKRRPFFAKKNHTGASSTSPPIRISRDDRHRKLPIPLRVLTAGFTPCTC